ncbi:MAG: hypothetical protein JXR95_13050 [Deltaproteobacteria bacterium]|nr:hypothetical protein [Deltaproteobacteria bacterium]
MTILDDILKKVPSDAVELKDVEELSESDAAVFEIPSAMQTQAMEKLMLKQNITVGRKGYINLNRFVLKSEKYNNEDFIISNVMGITSENIELKSLSESLILSVNTKKQSYISESNGFMVILKFLDIRFDTVHTVSWTGDFVQFSLEITPPSGVYVARASLYSGMIDEDIVFISSSSRVRLR